MRAVGFRASWTHGLQERSSANALLAIAHAAKVHESVDCILKVRFYRALPTAVHDGMHCREARHSHGVESGLLHLKQTGRIPLHRSIGIEERHGDLGVRHGIVVGAVLDPDPHLGTVILSQFQTSITTWKSLTNYS